MEDKYDDNNDKDISALGLDRDMGFSRGHQGRQGHWPHDDDNDEEEDNEVEDNDKDDDNNIKDDNDDKAISALVQIETWGFCENIKDVKGIGLMMMTMMRRTTTRWRTTTRMTTTTRTITMTRVSQLWD